MNIIASPFMYAAMLGLVVSVVIHIMALLGITLTSYEVFKALHLGIFIVGFPTIIILMLSGKDLKQKEFWTEALRACPKWMRNMTIFFFGYAILNFLLFVILSINQKVPTEISGSIPPNVLRVFSGHGMIFYCAAMALLYSTIHDEKHVV